MWNKVTQKCAWRKTPQNTNVKPKASNEVEEWGDARFMLFIEQGQNIVIWIDSYGHKNVSEVKETETTWHTSSAS